MIDAAVTGSCPLELFQQAHGDQGIRHLVVAAEAELHTAVVAQFRRKPDGGPAVRADRLEAHSGIGLDEGRSAELAHRYEDVARFRGHRADDDRDAAPEHSGFLRGNRRQRVAEILLVVEVDRGDRRGDGLDDVRGVEPAAESDLQDSDVDARPPKQLEPDGRGHFEERGRRFERSVRKQAVDQDLHFFE